MTMLRSVSAAVVAATAASILVSCGGSGGGDAPTAPVPPAPPAPTVATVTITPAETTLALNAKQKFTAIAKDASGSVMQTTVTWTASRGGSIDSTGTFTAGTTAGKFAAAIIATSQGVSSSATVVVTPGPAVNITPVAGLNQTVAAGAPVPVAPSVKVTDSYNNPIPGVTITFTIGAGGGSVTGATKVTDSTGTATVGGWTLGDSAGTNTLLASSAAISGTPTTFSATATKAVPYDVIMNTGYGQSANVNAPVPSPPSAKVVDVHGAPVAGVSVIFVASYGGGSVTGGTVKTDASGVATVGGWTLGATSGDDSLTATSPDITRTVGWSNLPPRAVFAATAIGVEKYQSIVSGGGDHTCALTTTQKAYCWGSNTSGQLGNGTTTPQFAAVAVAGGLRFTQVVAGATHSCGLTSDGTAYCWGAGDHGQLGDGAGSQTSMPSPVAGGLKFRSLGAGGSTTCGVTSAGAAYCWGANNYGQIGDGTTTTRTVPTAVAGGLVLQSIATSGTHTCGVTSSGAGYCWGYNYSGADGDGSNVTSGVAYPQQYSTPHAVVGGLAFASIVPASEATCGVTTSGDAYCWGADDFGELPVTLVGPQSSPNPVVGGMKFVSLSAGYLHTCGVNTLGTGYCFGDDSRGQLAGSVLNSTTTRGITGGLVLQSVAAGNRHSCALTTSGAAFCWGDNSAGQVGNGTTSTYSVLGPVPARMP